MTRGPDARFADILDAIDRCLTYRDHLDGADPAISSMAFDAVLRNLAVIGEAVRALPSGETDFAPQVPWASIAGLRNVVIHEYFRVETGLVLDIVNNELVPLASAIRGSRKNSRPITKKRT
jgi:uncharacterized protein with HEPN domain